MHLYICHQVCTRPQQRRSLSYAWLPCLHREDWAISVGPYLALVRKTNRRQPSMDLHHQCLCRLTTNKNHRHNHRKNVITGSVHSSSRHSDQLLEVAYLRVSSCPASCDGHKHMHLGSSKHTTCLHFKKRTCTHTRPQLERVLAHLKQSVCDTGMQRRVLLILAAVCHKVFTKIAPPVKCRRLASWCNAATA